MKVAIQGFEGSFHHIVANKYFGDDVELMTCKTFREVGAAVNEGVVDVAVMAIENSIAGSILANYKIVQNKGLKVVGEHYLSITQNLMALPGTRVEDITQVRSHPIALLQCMDYLEYRDWELVESEDTALSARHIAEQNLVGVGAVAGELAAELYGLEIVAPQINTIKNNQTRFLILARSDDSRFDATDVDKASMYLKLCHRQGSLLEALQILSRNNINMSLLQSCPIPENPFSYLFHMGLEFGSMDDLDRAVSELYEIAEEMHIYGVYKHTAIE